MAMFPKILHLISISLLSLVATAARYPSFGTLQTSNSSGVLNVVINNTFSSINLFDFHVQSDLANLIETLQANDTDIRVVFDPGFPDMVFPEALIWNITQLPQATIAAIEGLETSLGLNPGAGGAMYLAPLIGRGLAFEYVLSSADVDARTAASIGWINRAFDTSKELHDYVHALAARIALFPAAAVTGTKAGINKVSRPARKVLVHYAQDVILKLAGMPEVQAFLERFIVATNNQSVGPLELDYGKELFSLFNSTQVPRDDLLVQ
ncbi:ClpP/crotonase-like domain-containing protein [Mycena capillaripes]|nr:ClpP/crotonase-like domain-containing protein [Mycena capillaripes]